MFDRLLLLTAQALMLGEWGTVSALKFFSLLFFLIK